jgi:hypothetical protein
MIDRVLIPLFAQMTGYTEKAVRRKIEDGVWAEGLHWFRNPDGRIVLSLSAYQAWQTHQTRRASKSATTASA